MTIDWSINAANVIASAGLIASAVVVGFQIRAKRNDERWARHLTRIDQQLSNLYGPLFALYESGDKEWRAFRREYGPSKDQEFLGFFPINRQDPEFTPPDAKQLATFRTWSKAVFLTTNTRMADVMIDNAELLVGKTMPQPFLDFCVHVSSVRAAAASWEEADFNPNDWTQHLAIFPHPAASLHNHIRSSFTVLKDMQSQLLARVKCDVDERVLREMIDAQIRQFEAEERERLRGLQSERPIGVTPSSPATLAEPLRTA